MVAMPRKILPFVMLVALWAAPQAHAQQPAVETAVRPAALVLPDYQLGPGDQVSIYVQGVREFTRSGRISNTGRLRVPYVGIVFAAGRTVTELEREIAERIKEHELVNEPLVRVEVDQQRAAPAFVLGEVITPGQFVISGEMYLLDLITRAGGLQPVAGSVAYVYRRPTAQVAVTARVMGIDNPDAAEVPPAAPAAAQPPAAAEEGVIKIDLDALRFGSKPELNVRINGGDIVHVPRRQIRNIFIIGDVKVPGVYMLPRRGEVTAAQAIAYAGGPSATAKVKSGFLMRYDANGVHEAIPVHFSDILNGKSPDLPVLPGDIIFVPNSAVKTIGVGLLNMIPNLIIQFLIF
jgi:polysaccharide biosynthesis/export protein